MRIKVFTTGGTIDDLEYSSEKDAPTQQKSLIPQVLEDLGLKQYSITLLMNKDSRFVTDDDRALIAKSCKECEEDHIVITHGTITMVETAKYLDQLSIGKTIILTGAMVPANRPNSDAPENVRLAISEIQKLPAGVYISMSGSIFDANNVRKNPEKGVFEELGK
jgi:L-asparaginase